MVDRLLATTERQLNAKHPLVQARVLDGTARLTAAIPPIVGPAFGDAAALHGARRDASTSSSRATRFSAEAAAFLWAVMQVRIAHRDLGRAGRGEDDARWPRCSRRFRPRTACGVARRSVRSRCRWCTARTTKCARPGSTARGEIDLRATWSSSCWRCGPIVIVVGEVRGAEAFELTRAVNAGCGFLCTVHANSAPDALNALVNAALMAGENVTERIVRKVFAEALDLVVHLDRDDHPHAGRRAPAPPGHGDHGGRADDLRRPDVRADLRARRPRRAAGMDGRAPAGARAAASIARCPTALSLRALLERRAGAPGMRFLAALAVGTFCALLVGALARHAAAAARPDAPAASRRSDRRARVAAASGRRA